MKNEYFGLEKYWYEHQVEILVRERLSTLNLKWFGLLDLQPLHWPTKSKILPNSLKYQVKAKPLSLGANPSSIPYKPKELETLVQRNRKKKMYVDDHLMIRWYNDISSL